MEKYLFESSRLGFRNWIDSDIPLMDEINSDSRVMEFFPQILDISETRDFVSRMQLNFQKKGYCYFAVDRLDNQELIGFIGLMDQEYLSDPHAFVDIGWRLKHDQWGNGFATEGAKACLEFGINELDIRSIYAVASEINLLSINVMKKLGMQKVRTFLHPKLKIAPHLHKCVLYKTHSNS